jgi:hypothetical protein
MRKPNQARQGGLIGILSTRKLWRGPVTMSRINRLVYQMLKDEGHIEDTEKPGEIKFTRKDTG